MNCASCHLPIDPDAEEFVNVPGSGRFHGTCRPSVTAGASLEPMPVVSLGSPTPGWPLAANPWTTPQAWRSPEPVSGARVPGYVDASFLSGGQADDPEVVPDMRGARAPWNRNRPRW